MVISSEKTCFLVGSPVAHSLSPGMHRIIYRSLDLNWRYSLREIKEKDELKSFTREIKNSPESPGFNVTIPYKTDIIPLLESCDSAALKTGAVNTVIRTGSGLKGTNTDWVGLRDDLREELNYSGGSEDALILGAGGAARAAVYALAEGFGLRPGKIYGYDIYPRKAEKLTKDFKLPGICAIKDSGEIPGILSGSAILINATPAGMKPGPAPVDLDKVEVKPDLVVYDVVYNRKTELISAAEQKSLKCSGGAGMLSGQGARAFELWSGIKPGEDIRRKMKEFVRKKAEAA